MPTCTRDFSIEDGVHVEIQEVEVEVCLSVYLGGLLQVWLGSFAGSRIIQLVVQFGVSMGVQLVV